MSEVKVNKISPRTNCGTVTLGDSGDSFVIPAGATITNNGTQTGFGRTGTVDWQTSIKTSDFTAASGEGYFINTTSGTVTMTLPASPSAGDIVAIKDYANTFDTNGLTINRNSQPVGGETINPLISEEGIAVTLVYADSTKGWLVTNSGLQSEVPAPEFVAATGGTVTTVCTNFKVHTFTGPGTFCVSNAGNAAGSNAISYIIVAGGGGGGGDGGAGGFRESKAPACTYSSSPLSATGGVPVSVQAYPIVIGGGGAGATSPFPSTPGSSGSNSSGFSKTSAGGGGGHLKGATSGGSGGGGGRDSPRAGASGNTPSTTPPQGNDGGNGHCNGGAGGGGGATAAGVNASSSAGGAGGNGATSSINATPTARAGGGGGAATPSPNTKGAGGSGGGGNGVGCGPTLAVAGSTNTGGGGGGGTGGPVSGCGPALHNGGAGGSGIVIIRYRFQ